jgi:hypothetical protein
MQPSQCLPKHHGLAGAWRGHQVHRRHRRMIEVVAIGGGRLIVLLEYALEDHDPLGSSLITGVVAMVVYLGWLVVVVLVIVPVVMGAVPVIMIVSMESAHTVTPL